MDIDTQPRKLSSPRKPSNKNAEIIAQLCANAWWPFDRVDGKILERLHKDAINQIEEAPL